MSDVLNNDEEGRMPLSDGAQFFDNVAAAFRFVGIDTAADNLARYRSAAGGTHVFPNEVIDSHPLLRRYEDENRTLFESYSFVGENARGQPTGYLQDLADGETIPYQDHFSPARIPLHPSTYLAFGQTGVLSQFKGTATRAGEDILIEGEVAHDFNGGNGRGGELFDFNPRQPGRLSAVQAEAAGEARPFTMAMDRRQTVSALARREPDGLLTLQSVTWGPVR